MSVLGVRREVKGRVAKKKCAGGVGEHGDRVGHGMCRGCEWGLAFCMWFAMPGYIIMLPDSTSF